MRIAIPLANGKLSMHVGHCEGFTLVDVDPAEKRTLARQEVDAPPHEPGLLPGWPAQRNARLISAGGIGQRAAGLFAGRAAST